MKKLIILGTTAFSEIVCQSIEQDGLASIIAFAVEKEFLKESIFCSRPVVSFEDLSELYDMSNVLVLNTIGYAQMNDIRKRITTQCENLGYKQFTYISPRAKVDPMVSIGVGSIILPYVEIGANVLIGKGCILFYGACITHHIEIGDYCFISSGVVIGGCTSVANNCFIGINATIANDLIIARYTFVGATCYVAKSTEEYSAYVKDATKKIDRWTSLDLIRLVN